MSAAWTEITAVTVSKFACGGGCDMIVAIDDESGDYIEFNEAWAGFDQVMQEIIARLPGADAGWKFRLDEMNPDADPLVIWKRDCRIDGPADPTGISEEILDVYSRFSGDADGFARTGSAWDRTIIDEQRWHDISVLLQEMHRVKSGRASAEYAAHVEARVSAVCRTESVRRRIWEMAKGDV